MARRPAGYDQALPQHQTNGSNAPVYVIDDDNAGQGMSIQDILDTLLKGKWIILASFVLVFAAFASFTARQDPIYQARGTIQVDATPSIRFDELQSLMNQGRADRNLPTEVAILTSRMMAMRVADRMIEEAYVPGTTDYFPLILDNQGRIRPTLSVALRLQRSMDANQTQRDVQIVEITAVSNVPAEASFIVNTYAEEFETYSIESSRQQTTASREFLTNVTASLDSSLTTAEQGLIEFAEEEGVIAPDESARQLVMQISEMQQDLYQTQLELELTVAQKHALQNQLDRLEPGLQAYLIQEGLSVDDQFAAALRSSIASLQFEKEKLLVEHPSLREDGSDLPLERERVSGIERQIAAYYTQLKDRVSKQTENALTPGLMSGSAMGAIDKIVQLQENIFERDLAIEAFNARIAALKDLTLQYEEELDQIPNRSMLLASLERTYQTRERIYTFLSEKLQESRLAEQSEVGYVTLIDEALVPGNPISPNIMRNLLLGAAMGLILGIGLSFLRNMVDTRVRSPEDLRKRGFNVIGVIPDMQRVIQDDFEGHDRMEIEGKSISTSLMALLSPHSAIADAYRRLRTSLQFSDPDRSVHVIMVTSPSPGEGKSVTAMNLAITMAQLDDRRTLYIDGDLRRADGHRMLGIEREPGLVDLLFKPETIDIEQFATDIDNLYVIPAGSSVTNPVEVLGSNRMKELIGQLREMFDVVVIDTPPLLAVPEAVILSTQCDGCLVVGYAGKTDWQAIERGAEALHEVGGHIAGIVLNRFDARSAGGYGKYGGYYGYGYYYYYGYGYGSYYYGEEQKKKKRTSNILKD